jgi:hypothetical protein
LEVEEEQSRRKNQDQHSNNHGLPPWVRDSSLR